MKNVGFLYFNWFLTLDKRELQEQFGNFSVRWINVTSLNSNNRPFARSSYLYEKSHIHCTQCDFQNKSRSRWTDPNCFVLELSHVQLVSKHV